LIDAGKSFAREMTGYSLAASRIAREAVRRGLACSLTDGLRIEADLNTLAFQTTDAAEGMTAFLEKRSPIFRDR
jgi:enoyl-CoA hydratase